MPAVAGGGRLLGKKKIGFEHSQRVRQIPLIVPAILCPVCISMATRCLLIGGFSAIQQDWNDVNNTALQWEPR